MRLHSPVCNSAEHVPNSRFNFLSSYLKPSGVKLLMMNNLLRVAFRASNIRAILKSEQKKIFMNAPLQQRQITRNLWYMCKAPPGTDPEGKLSKVCTCGCGSGRHQVHTKGKTVTELVEYLTEEIIAERKAQKSKTLPTELEGFKVQLNGAEIILTKPLDNENIKITLNVNHSVDSDVEPELNPSSDKAEIGQLKSKPDFKVEISRGKTTLSFHCSFTAPNEQDEGYNDLFGLDEMSIYDGEWNEKAYAVSGEVLDSYLYDLIMNYLEEKGISNEFVEKLSEYSTSYEHSAYMGLLEGLSKFASGK